MRITRTMRGLLAAAVTVGALLALPGSSFAAANFVSSSALTSTGPYEAGGTATYTLDIVNTGDAGTGTAGTISLTEDGMDLVIVGTPTKADGPGAGADMSGEVTVAAGSNDITIGNAFTTGDARVTFVVQLPSYYDGSFNATATGSLGTASFSEQDSFRTVSKGGPSDPVVTFADDAARWVAKDGTYTANFTVRNDGTGSAEFVRLSPSSWESANVFSPDWAPNPMFDTTATITSGCSSMDGGTCIVNSIAAGASHTLQLTVTGITHYGSVSAYVSASAADAAGSCCNGGSQYFQVTNGKSVAARVDVEGPTVASGNTDLTYTGEVVNAGPDAIDPGILVIEPEGFSPSGTEVESIKSITLSNGNTCAPAMNNYVAPPVAKKNEWHCSLSAIASGQRITFTAVANFPTTAKNESAQFDAYLVTAAYLTPDSNASDTKWTTLNPEKTVDLQTTLSSTSLVGADRVAAVTVTVKNAGNFKAEGVTLSGDVYGTGGVFDAATLPTNCSGVNKPQFASCGLGTIEAGQSKSFTINVRGGASLGSIAVSFAAWHNGAGYELNNDDNTQSLVLDIVKANTVPLNGVVVAKSKPQTIAQLLKTGSPTTVTCPVACSAVVELQLNRKVAERLGWVKKPRGMRRAKALPYLVIGKATKSTTAAGKVTVTVKLTKAYAAKAAKLKSALTVSKVVTVMSTDAATKDASFKKAQNVVFKPAPKRRR